MSEELEGPPRQCPQCEAPLERRKGEGWMDFALRVYCNRACYIQALRSNRHSRLLGSGKMMRKRPSK
jgi:hypothetical protein